MPKRKQKTKKQPQTPTLEPDSLYFLKLVMYLLLGSFWIRVVDNSGNGLDFSIPVGFIIGLVFASHDHFQIDRKIEYAILLITVAVSYYLPIGFLV